jgi:hypothetical protein
MNNNSQTISEINPINPPQKHASDDGVFAILDTLSLGVEQYIDPDSVYRKTIVEMTVKMAEKMGIPTQSAAVWAEKNSKPKISELLR